MSARDVITTSIIICHQRGESLGHWILSMKNANLEISELEKIYLAKVRNIVSHGNMTRSMKVAQIENEYESKQECTLWVTEI